VLSERNTNEPKTTATKEEKGKALDTALHKLQNDMDVEDRKAMTAQEPKKALDAALDKSSTVRESLLEVEDSILNGMATIGLHSNEVYDIERLELTDEQKKKIQAAYPTAHPKEVQKFRNNLFKALPTGSPLHDELPPDLRSSFLKWDTYRMRGQQEEFEDGLHEDVLSGYHKLGLAMKLQVFANMIITVLGPKIAAKVEAVLEENRKPHHTVVRKRVVAEPVPKKNQDQPWLSFIGSERLSAEQMHKVKADAPTLIAKALKQFRNDLFSGKPTGSRLHDELPKSTKTAFLRADGRHQEAAGGKLDSRLGLSQSDFQKLSVVMAQQVMRNVVATVLGSEIADDAVMVLQENQESRQQVARKSKS